MSARIEVENNEVLIDYRQFHLYEFASVIPTSDDDSSSSWIQFSDSRIYFLSEVSDHYASVVMELWDGEPERNTEHAWEVFSRLRVQLASNNVSVWTTTMGPANLEFTLQPGWYNLHASCVGRQEIKQVSRSYIDGEDWPRSIERYLLQFWPAQ